MFYGQPTNGATVLLNFCWTFQHVARPAATAHGRYCSANCTNAREVTTKRGSSTRGGAGGALNFRPIRVCHKRPFLEGVEQHPKKKSE